MRHWSDLFDDFEKFTIEFEHMDGMTFKSEETVFALFEPWKLKFKFDEDYFNLGLKPVKTNPL